MAIAMNASIFLTMVIALERYLAVSKPFTVSMGGSGSIRRKWKTVSLYVLPAILLAILVNIPMFFELTDKPAIENNNSKWIVLFLWMRRYFFKKVLNYTSAPVPLHLVPTTNTYRYSWLYLVKGFQNTR